MQRSGRLGRIYWLTVALGLTLAASHNCIAQEVGSIDLTQGPRAEFRRPVPNDYEDSGRRTGGHDIHGCDNSSTDGGALQARLVWLDRDEYAVGDTDKFQVRLENVGPAPIAIPFSPNPADVQPADESQKFRYSELKVELRIGGERWSVNTAGTATLYGSETHSGTMLTLHPGEWALIIGRGKIALSEDDMVFIRKGDPVNHATARVSIYGSETLPTASASATVSRCTYLVQSQEPSIAVKVDAPK